MEYNIDFEELDTII
jgi:hypothetical protein